jgi:cytochrome c553
MKAILKSPLQAALLLLLIHDGFAQSVTPRADVAVCTGCHGARGEGSSSIGAPRLAGQNVEYMSHALSMFKAGTRASPVMQPIAQGLDDGSIDELTRYFAQQSAPPVDAKAPAAAALLRSGKQFVEAGPAPCFGCHGEGGRGNGARYPSIVGQPVRFTVDRIHEFQQRARAKTPQPGSMTAVSTMLSEEQIAASAAYLSRLQP